MNTTYYFCHKDDSFINVEVVFCFVVSWICAGLIVYAFFVSPIHIPTFSEISKKGLLVCLLQYPSILFFCVAIFFMHNPFSYLKERKRLFKYNENTSLLIDTKLQTFTYKQRDKIFRFNASDVSSWSWRGYGPPPPNSTDVEIIDIRMKNGEKIIISSGIGNVLDLFRENWKELGLPQGQISTNSLRTYMKEIEKQQEPSL